MMMAWSLYNHMIADQVKALLDASDEDNKDRADFTPSMEREKAENAIHAILWAYSSRAGDTAAGYAWLNLWRALGVDWTSLKHLPADSGGDIHA
jgi:hypothetical protein